MPPTSASPRKAPRQERSRRTVERILDAAAHVFHEQGYTAATTNDIADEAEVSIGSLYQYFPNKDALLVALTRRHIESATAGLTDLLGQLRTDDGFEPVLRAVVDFLVEQHHLDDLHVLVMHTAPRTHEIGLELDRAKNLLVDLTSELLSTAVEDRRHRALAARMVVATIDAAVHDVIIRQPRGATRRAAIDLTISTAMSIIDASTTGSR
jgi:AcrR family transcriptional regulator